MESNFIEDAKLVQRRLRQEEGKKIGDESLFQHYDYMPFSLKIPPKKKSLRNVSLMDTLMSPVT
jgi:hypothetical protein